MESTNSSSSTAAFRVGTLPNKNGFTSLDNFIKAYTQPEGASYSSYIKQWSGLFFSFAANGKLTLWDPATAKTAKPSAIGSATYTRRTTPSGQEVLILNAQAPENKQGQKVMFAVKDGVMYGGSFHAASAKGSSDPLFNKTMMNAILAAGNKPAVID